MLHKAMNVVIVGLIKRISQRATRQLNCHCCAMYPVLGRLLLTNQSHPGESVVKHGSGKQKTAGQATATAAAAEETGMNTMVLLLCL